MTSKPLYLSQSDVPARFGTVPSLDGLRAGSVFIVMLSHYVDANLFPGGFGVLVFFVISGFLITRLMLAEHKRMGHVSIRSFYLRRFLRLYPAILVYTIVVVLAFFALGRPVHWAEPISALFYFANYLYSYFSLIGQTGGTMPFAIFWSLSVEEHFYMVFPLACALMAFVPGRLFAMCVGICVVCLGLRIGVAQARPELLDSYVFYYQTQFRLDSLAFGVLIATACELETGRALIRRLCHPAFFLAALALVFACLLYRNVWFRETWRYSLMPAGVAVLVIGILFSPRYRLLQQALNLAPVAWMGRISYSLYVWHVAMPYPGYEGGGHGRAFNIALAFVMSFIVGAASYYGIERPFLRLRKRFGSHDRRTDEAPEPVLAGGAPPPYGPGCSPDARARIN